jgi:predicted amidophosphoribosyltransferase
MMAQQLGRDLSRPVHNILGRQRGKSMAALASRHRALIAKSQFFVRKQPPRDRVLLIDDVLTTGATASACAALLKSKGVKEVHLIAAASPLI